MLVLMLLQRVIEVVLLLVCAPKVHRRVQPAAARRAADSTRCIGLCVRCTRSSTMPPGELSANA